MDSGDYCRRRLDDSAVCAAKPPHNVAVLAPTPARPTDEAFV
jgi:hypothetical protein